MKLVNLTIAAFSLVVTCGSASADMISEIMAPIFAENILKNEDGSSEDPIGFYAKKYGLEATSENVFKEMMERNISSRIPVEEGDFRSKVEDVVKSSLKDPSSAIFGEIFEIEGTPYVCGYVNARNSYGGYVGEKIFFGVASKFDDGNIMYSTLGNFGDDVSLYSCSLYHAP